MRFRARIAAGLVVGLATVIVGGPVPSLAIGRACAAGQLHVAIVVDFDGVASTTSTCVPVGSHYNGATALAERAHQLGTPAPRFGSSGLLCAIDGIPADGCGETHGTKYAYWSYFHGTGGHWSYANNGPGGSRVNADVVEGWRWQPDGAGNPSDPPPRGSAGAAAICEPAPPPPLPPSATTIAVASSPASSPRAVPGATAAPAGTSAASTTVARGATSTVRGADNPTSSAGGSSSTLDPSGVAAARTQRPDGGGGGPPYGLLFGGFLVGALAIVGLVVARRRRRPAS